MTSNSEKGKWAVLSSALTLIICFIGTYTFYQYLITAIARGLGYHVKFTFNEAYLPWDPSIWDRGTVTEVNLYPLIICFFLGFTLLWMMKYQRETWGRYQLAGFWTMVCLINIPMSQLLYAPFGVADIYSVFYFGIARVAVWYHIPFAVQLILAMIAFILIVLFGVFWCKQVLKLSHSFSRIERRPGKNNMIIRLYFAPILIVFVPILLLGKDMLSLRLAVMLVSLTIPIIGMFLKNSLAIYQVRFEKSGTGDFFPLPELIMAVALWLFVFIRLV